MKPAYQIALLLSVPAGFAVMWNLPNGFGPWQKLAAAMLPAIIVCLVATFDKPRTS